MRRKLLIAGGVTTLIALIALTQVVCLTAYWKWGIVTRRCPSGTPRLTCTVAGGGLRRGQPGSVSVSAHAHFTTSAADEVRTEPLRKFEPRLFLVDSAGKETPLETVRGWNASGGTRDASLTLPEVGDGDYKLRVRITSALGSSEADMPLPLFTPARVHVITDRPLYEPGNLVRFRALALRARDLAPIDQRPGVWVVTDPEGEVLLEEKAPVGKWGVVAGSFPLDSAAAVGTWKVAWRSGDAADEVTFTVEPFTLPRFRIDVTPDKPSYGKGDRPSVSGAVLYSSGAPVAGAEVTIGWGVEGAWPAPTEWTEGTALPKTAISGANGRFTLAIPQIPADLRGQATLVGNIAAVDGAGDRVEGQVRLLLSADPIRVGAVTELGEGLVQGFNNRVYLRVTRADGSVLADTKLKVKRAWEASDPGTETTTDADGVASLQFDPGPPVNVVEDPMPVRPPPAPPPVRRGEVSELLVGEDVGLAEQTAMDGWLAPLAACGKWVEEDEQLAVALRVSGGGAVTQVITADEALGQCAAGVLRNRRLPGSGERLYSVTFHFAPARLPRVSVTLNSAVGTVEGLEELLSSATLGARDCLPEQESGDLPRAIVWQVRAGQRDITTTWVRDADAEGRAREDGSLGALTRADACVASRLGRLALDEPADGNAIGTAHLELVPSFSESTAPAEPTVRVGYELEVAAADIGTTKLFVAPGSVPPLRLRATPVLAKTGDRVRLELIRGPGYRGAVPLKIDVSHFSGSAELDVDQKTREAVLVVDEKLQGWVELRARHVDARALVYVQPKASLAVALKSEPRYAPGQLAKLQVSTLVDGSPGSAAVGLFGVDETLGQLATLRGADDLARLRPTATMSSPAFGVLDGQALALGRIRGANAAAATILRVQAIPTVPELDAFVSGHGESQFDPVAELTDRFYVILDELHAQGRRWHAETAPGEQMTPRTMAKLWARALDEAAKRGEKVVDAYGRRLELWRLPPDLLALTDPQVVMTDGTRLPEDVENWADWVAKEKP